MEVHQQGEAVLGDWTKEERREALASISTLKRALGFANHLKKADTFGGEKLRIYTPDEHAAQVIGELLYRYANGTRTAHYNSRPNILTVRDTIKVEPLEEGGFEVSMWLPYAPRFPGAMHRIVEKHIAPDRCFNR